MKRNKEDFRKSVVEVIDEERKEGEEDLEIPPRVLVRFTIDDINKVVDRFFNETKSGKTPALIDIDSLKSFIKKNIGGK